MSGGISRGSPPLCIKPWGWWMVGLVEGGAGGGWGWWRVGLVEGEAGGGWGWWRVRLVEGGAGGGWDLWTFFARGKFMYVFLNIYI